MKMVTFAGPPSSGKTSVILQMLAVFKRQDIRLGVVKFDALAGNDAERYRRAGIAVQEGISGHLCPDHYFISNIADCYDWGITRGFDVLVTESAGLCHRCSPHIEGVLSVAVVDNLAGVHTPRKIGPLLRLADIVVVAKGDIVSQAEREVFAFQVKMANPGGKVLFVNGITGQGAAELARLIFHADEQSKLQGGKIRFPMPSAICTYCIGSKTIGDAFAPGKKICFQNDL